jgi:hypothetical protein
LATRVLRPLFFKVGHGQTQILNTALLFLHENDDIKKREMLSLCIIYTYGLLRIDLSFES